MFNNKEVIVKLSDEAIKDAVKTGYVLHGSDKLVGVIKDVTSF